MRDKDQTSLGGPRERLGAALLKPAKIVRIEDLMGEGKEVTILNGDEQYRLRVTSNKRLILTK